MECNLDARGKATRLTGGIFGVLLGVCLLGISIALPDASYTLPGISVAIILGGAFSIFEGWSGWCVIRAIGIRTPL